MSREMMLIAGALCLCAAIIGYVLGQRAVTPLDESEVIQRWAAHYVQSQGEGAAMSDCTATVGAMAAVWMQVICTPAKDGAPAIVYEIGPDGEAVDGRSEEAPGI